MNEKLYIEVILPVPLADSYTYSVPLHLQKNIVPGSLVLVEFGKSKRYSGIVAYIHTITPITPYEIKEIIAVENEQPVLRRPQLRFWEWLSQYYLCRPGEVYKAVLPSGFRTESATTYKPKKELFVSLSSQYGQQDSLRIAFDKVKNAPRQEQLLLAFIEYTHDHTPLKQRSISKKDLLFRSGVSDNVLATLVEKGILHTEEKDVSRLNNYQHKLSELHLLKDFQQKAYTEIVGNLREKDVCLLHGVTASGKTEIYIRLIAETLKLQRQVLFLLPEIALTTQITSRLKQFFGDQLGVYHSKINNNERVEIWNNLLSDEGYQIILGVRSSIFLPFRDLGLIIVDEEHEPGYKQQDPAPRYHSRNAAIVLATMHGAKVILGSATPSIESFYNAQTGKYGYVCMNRRFEETELPEIFPVDVKELRRKKKMKGIFSPLLIENMKQTLEKEEQIILFQNRRGFAPMILCKICDWTPKCRFCDVALTYHKSIHKLTCHYCGSTYQVPHVCPECDNKELKSQGFGTEQVEEEIKSLFPHVAVARMDTDTTQNKKNIESIISDFEKGNIQILVGTQMISKGLDFNGVGLVGILNADSMMNFPDFRAHERAYQLMAQVAGRAGRRKHQGKVILQTSHPEHPLIQFILSNNYEGMYKLQMEERSLFKYPPLYRLIEISLKHKNEVSLKNSAEKYAEMLRMSLGDRVIGPDKPMIGKIQSMYLRKIILKIEISASLNTLREILKETQNRLLEDVVFKSTVIQYNVDPV